jgi:hypothetical protein
MSCLEELLEIRNNSWDKVGDQIILISQTDQELNKLFQTDYFDIILWLLEIKTKLILKKM